MKVYQTAVVVVETSIEVCNGRDDDCDNRTDEGVLNACGACGDVALEVSITTTMIVTQVMKAQLPTMQLLRQVKYAIFG